MKLTLLEKVYLWGIAVIFAGIIIHAPLSVGLGSLFPDYSVLIKSWKEILMLGLMVAAFFIVTKRHMWQELLNDWIIRLIMLYASVHLILANVMFEGTGPVLAGLAIDLRYVLYFLLVYVALRIAPQYRSVMIRVGIIGACVVVGFGTLQLFLPPDILSHIGYSRDTIMPYLTVDQNPEYIRVNSTLRGPNPLGAYTVIVLGLIAAIWIRSRAMLKERRMAILIILLGICAITCLWISYSRSALVAGIVTVLIVLMLTIGRKMSRSTWIASTVIVCSILGTVIAARDTPFVANVVLHENQNGGSAVSSNDGHVESLHVGTERLFGQPFGGGVGSAGSASLYGDSPMIIENQYLFIAHETGWLGLLIFIALFGLIMRSLWQQRQDWLSLGVFASGIGLSLIGLLLPVWADDTVSIVWWGLAAIAIAGGRHAK